MGARARTVAALGSGALIALAGIAALIAHVAGDEGASSAPVVDAVTKVILGLGAGWLAWARPRHPLGWLLLAVTACSAAAELAGALATLPAVGTGGLRFTLAWVASFLWFPGFALLPTVVLALYPTGHAGSRARRVLLMTGLAGTVLLTLGFALVEDAVDDVVPGLANPFALHTVGPGLAIAGAVLLVPSVLLTIVDAGRRLWRAQSPEREQLAWLLTAVVLAVTMAYTPWPTVRELGFLFVPLGLLVGVVRHRLLDLQVVVRRTLLFLGLTGCVVGVFALSTALLSGLVPGDSMSVAVAGALVAVGLLPARDLLQRAVDRLVYGDRRDPLRAVASLGRDVAEHEDERLVPQVLRTVATAVRSPHVALLDKDGARIGEHGVPGAAGAPLRLPLQVGGRVVGRLDVAPRTLRDTWSGDDRVLLELIARQVAVVVHSCALNAQLTRSRARVLQATADERQRLHQELHDGLGPALSGIALGLEAAEVSLTSSPVRVAALLARLREETQAAGHEVRRLVEGLRPAALDRQGLDEALATFVEGLRNLTDGRLDVELQLPQAFPPLHPGVDAAAYRIVTEAVTNVLRHSGASRCTVTVRATEEDLRLVVVDDGHGLPAQPRAGVGLDSMRRRAAALGGTWTAGPGEAGGTRVEVVLPAWVEVPG